MSAEDARHVVSIVTAYPASARRSTALRLRQYAVNRREQAREWPLNKEKRRFLLGAEAFEAAAAAIDDDRDPFT